MATTANTVDNSSVQALYSSLNGSKAKDSTSTTSGAQDRFLTLLTAQLKNQDPLNPLDNAQMTSQLAQISTVDGIEKLNKTLQTLLGNAADTQVMQAAALVGRQVLVEGKALALQQGLGAAGVDLAGPADAVTATIKDANGLVVRTLALGALPAGTQVFGWDGKSDNGSVAADGDYTVSFTAIQGQDKVTATALQFGPVNGILRNSQGVSLDLGSLGIYSMSDIKQIL